MTIVWKAAIASGLLLGLTACNDSEQRAATAVAQAEKLVAQGDKGKARVEYANALKARPLDPKINLALAKLEDADGDIASAMPHYLRAASADARLIEAQLRVVEVLIESGRLTDASGVINTTIGSFPKSPDAFALRADIEDRQSDRTAARADVDAALRLDPKNARALSVLALLQLKSNDAQNALKTVDQGLVQAPGNLRLLQVRAAILLTLDDPARALDAFQAIIRAEPSNVMAYRVMAGLEVKEGRFDKALETFKKAVEANPNDQAMQLGFIAFLESQGKASTAIDRLKGLVAENPTANTYDLVLAELYRSHNDVAAASKVLVQAAERLKDTPSGLSVQVALAKLDIAAGQAQTARGRLDAILSADPKNREALIVRASVLMSENSFDAAVSDLLNVVKFYPLDGPAFELLSTAYMQLGQKGNAIDAMRRAVAVLPGNDAAELKLAVFLQSAGAVDAAKEIVARITVRRDQSVEAWVIAARLAAERQDWNAATRAVARLRELHADQAAASIDAQIKLGQGDAAGAFASYRTLLASGTSTDKAILAGFARAAVSSGHIDEGIAGLTKQAASLSGENLQLVWTLIMTMQADGRHFDEAAAAFKKAVDVDPAAVAPYATFATILVAQKNYDTALGIVKQGLASGADKADLLNVQGGIQQAQSRLPEALASYQESFAAKPTSLEALNNYASLLADIKPKDTKALAEARERLVGKEKSRAPNLIDTIAWLDYRLGRFEEAKLLLNGIDAAKQSNPQIRFHLAAVLLATGDKERGMALLKDLRGQIFLGSQEANTLSEG